ncbi:MAG: MOSC domain-containing protein [Actinomycetota bacterium]|nr:MOSC domain-containing protein [Actinomycetota bacterium]
MTAQLLSVNIGLAVPAPYGNEPDGRTAIDKRPVAERVALHRLGVEGNETVHPAHGGVDKAVYAYAREDALWWEAELGRPLSPGAFGENLTTEGLDINGAEIGQRWRIGEAVVEVSEPRIPCTVFAGFWDVPDLIKRFTRRGQPGAYLRVVTEGAVAAGDLIEVVHRPGHGVSLAEAFRARTGERDLVPRLLEATELPAAWHAWAHRVLGHRGEPTTQRAERDGLGAGAVT